MLTCVLHPPRSLFAAGRVTIAPGTAEMAGIEEMTPAGTVAGGENLSSFKCLNLLLVSQY